MFYNRNGIQPIGPEVTTAGSTPAFKCNGMVATTACASCTDLKSNGVVNNGNDILKPL